MSSPHIKRGLHHQRACSEPRCTTSARRVEIYHSEVLRDACSWAVILEPAVRKFASLVGTPSDDVFAERYHF